MVARGTDLTLAYQTTLASRACFIQSTAPPSLQSFLSLVPPRLSFSRVSSPHALLVRHLRARGSFPRSDLRDSIVCRAPEAVALVRASGLQIAIAIREWRVEGARRRAAAPPRVEVADRVQGKCSRGPTARRRARVAGRGARTHVALISNTEFHALGSHHDHSLGQSTQTLPP